MEEVIETEKQATKNYWKDFNEQCLKCNETCKQSSKVQIQRCLKGNE